jgi:hypothetical protein
MKTHNVKDILLFEFNWRWKKLLKRQSTMQQFSRDYRKVLKKYE